MKNIDFIWPCNACVHGRFYRMTWLAGMFILIVNMKVRAWYISKFISLFCVLMQRIGRIWVDFLQISGIGNPGIIGPCVSENK